MPMQIQIDLAPLIYLPSIRQRHVWKRNADILRYIFMVYILLCFSELTRYLKILREAWGGGPRRRRQVIAKWVSGLGATLT